jgi:sulfur carrier protein
MAMNPIRITVNGAARSVQPPVNLTQLLASLGLDGKPVVVEMNGEAVFPREHDSRTIHDGAVLEIVTLAAGG